MLYRLRTRATRFIFDRQISGIGATPPIEYRPAPWTILSMVSHADLAMYLVAVKSFYRHLQSGKLLVIDDGSLTDKDRETIRTHLVAPEIIDRSAISIGRFPRHIMWERLACALDLSAREYVIQLDADTITIGPVDEVRRCAAENLAFTLGTWWHGLERLTIAQAVDYARQSSAQDHIQVQAELALTALPRSHELYYIRGSAGLAGLSRGGFRLADAEEFFVAMTQRLGKRFLEWGTDQVAFNFIVANSRRPSILPYPAYACFGPEIGTDHTSVFLHFIGTYRFSRGEFARQAAKFIAGEFSGGDRRPHAADG